MINAVELQNQGYHLWLAHWGIAAHNWSPAPALWQYSNGSYGDADISGIGTRVDRNWMYTGFNIDSGKKPDPISPSSYKLTVTDQYSNKVTESASSIIAKIVEAEVGGFGAEVWKAQAVAAHTWLQYQYSDGYEAPRVSLKAPSAEVLAAVQSVEGIILQYNGRAALTPYFAYSNGKYTNDAKYWNTANDLPYLSGVPSTESVSAKTYTISKSKLQARLKTIYGADITAGYATKDWIKITSRNHGSYVTGLNVCGRTPKVDYFISTMFAGIGSPDFSVSYDAASENFSFTYRGYGHCIGMSQTGAQQLAKQGQDYKAILQHYYPGTMFRNIFSA
jgi:SpoIID/LytB domain protein